MAFWGKYGNLPSLQAAIFSLKDIERDIKGYTLSEWCDYSVQVAKRYDDMRLLRQIEGLQRVIVLNGGDLGFSRLPLLYDKEKDRAYSGN